MSQPVKPAPKPEKPYELLAKILEGQKPKQTEVTKT
jgi:hypothetical protein